MSPRLARRAMISMEGRDTRGASRMLEIFTYFIFFIWEFLIKTAYNVKKATRGKLEFAPGVVVDPC